MVRHTKSNIVILPQDSGLSDGLYTNVGEAKLHLKVFTLIIFNTTYSSWARHCDHSYIENLPLSYMLMISSITLFKF